MRPRFSRWPAWLVLVSLFGNQVLFAYEPERSYWEQRRQEKAKRFATPTGTLLARGPSLGGSSVLPAVEKISPRADYSRVVSLPAGLNESVRSYFSAVPIANATIRKIHLPKNGNPRGLVFHILDVHRNLDAQTNIAHTVTSLIGLPPSSPIAMVGLEGAFRPYDLTWLRSFPDPGATRMAAEDLLAQDKMSGPMFSLLTASTPIPPVIGIDDEPHYQANLSAYRRSLATKEADRGHIKNRTAQLEREKSVAFNKELKAFDQTVQAYHRGTVSLGTYTRALAHKGASPLAKPIALFLQALEKEETLDFKEVERERARLLESLAQKMSPSQTNELISRSMAYRAGQLAYGDFYRWIKTLCDAVDVPLTRFPAMNEYIHYVLLSETINAEELLEECRQREKNLFDLMAKSDVERAMVTQSHALTLTEKLLDFSLTPDEWADYEQVRGRAGEALELEPYESFYKQAHDRDGAMAHNVLGAMEKSANTPASDVPVSIIVTGGYHGPGLNEKLTRAGMAVVTVVPKIEKIDTIQGSSYLTVFAQEKTPLDKLFEGAKLFVADAPLPQTTAALQAAGAAMVSQTTGESFPPKTLVFLKKHFQRVSVVQNDGISEITLALFDKKFTVRYDPTQPMGKKIQAGQPSDLNFFQQWFQSRGIDGRILTIGSALIVAGVWFFISGPSAIHQMGPLVSAIGLLTILGNWTPDGRLVALSTGTRPFSALLDQSPVLMASVGGEGREGLVTGRQEALPSRQPGDPWMDLSDIPEGFLRGRTVIVRTNLDDTQISYDDMRLVLAAKTVRHLTKAGAKVVLLSHRGRPNGFDQNGTLNKRAEMLGVMAGKEIILLPGDHGDSFRWLSDSDKEAIRGLKNGEVVILQNTRFDLRETSNDPAKRHEMAQELVDIVPDALFVLDGFPIAHRFDTASMDGLAQLLPGVKGLWQSLEEAQHNEFLLRLDSPEQRGKLTVIFGGGKLDKQVEIEAFAREHLRWGDTLIVGGLFSGQLLDSGLTSELENRGVTILLPDPAERQVRGNTYEDVGPTFTEKAIEAISNAHTVFWEGPLGRYRDPHSNSLKVAQAITRWAEADSKRRAFVSGGSTSYLFKEANGWDEKKRVEARRITVSTGGGTSIFYFAHRGRLPGTDALRGWEPKGHTDLNNDPNFWRDILKDPRTYGYVFVVDKNGNFEAHSRRILPRKYGSDLFNDVTQMLILQERVNVGFGSTVDASGVPVPGRFFVTEGHQDFVVFDKDGNPHLLGENENPADRLLNSETVLAAIQNPDRAKRSGSEPGKTRDAAENDPDMRVLTAESILKKFPLEVFLVWKSKSGTEWWGTGNRAAYYSNDPNGNPLEQVDHVTFSSSVDGKSQSEIGSLETLRDLT